MLKAVLPLRQKTPFPARLQQGCRRPLHCPLSSQSCRTSGPTCLCSNASQRNSAGLGPPVKDDSQ